MRTQRLDARACTCFVISPDRLGRLHLDECDHAGANLVVHTLLHLIGDLLCKKKKTNRKTNKKQIRQTRRVESATMSQNSANGHFGLSLAPSCQSLTRAATVYSSHSPSSACVDSTCRAISATCNSRVEQSSAERGSAAKTQTTSKATAVPAQRSVSPSCIGIHLVTERMTNRA